MYDKSKRLRLNRKYEFFDLPSFIVRGFDMNSYSYEIMKQGGNYTIPQLITQALNQIAFPFPE